MPHLEDPYQVVNMTSFHNIQKSWSLRDIKPTLINPLLLKHGHRVLQDGLQTFLFNLLGMHTPTPKIQEVMEFQR
jgi:hypothetical protein